jgi:hypothetical protein
MILRVVTFLISFGQECRILRKAKEVTYKKIEYEMMDRSIATAIEMLVDGQQFIDDVQELKCKGYSFQQHICHLCGLALCTSGCYLTLRKSSGMVIFMISIEDYYDYIGEDHFDEVFAISKLISEKGSILISEEDYKRLEEVCAGVIAYDDIAELTGKEAAFIYKCDSPKGLFGDFDKGMTDKIRADLITDSGYDKVIDLKFIIEKRLSELESAQSVTLIKSDQHDEKVTLATVRNETWDALCKSTQGYELLCGEYIITF